MGTPVGVTGGSAISNLLRDIWGSDSVLGLETGKALTERHCKIKSLHPQSISLTQKPFQASWKSKA